METDLIIKTDDQTEEHTGEIDIEIPAGSVRAIPCDNCGGEDFRKLFEKKSSRGEAYTLVSCKQCDLVQVNPQPDADAVKPYYDAHYFQKRTDRGYDNYFSPELKKQIKQVYDLNLRDLDFHEYEVALQSRKTKIPPRALDAGCAAGYFVEYLLNRGWKARGMEISAAAARYGIQELGLDIIIDDFLTSRRVQASSLDLISFWASIEHMHSPRRVLERCHELLKPGARLLLSTCNYGSLAKIRGANWRYMNVPEHLYFFSTSGLIKLAEEIGLGLVKSITYGSGFTTRKNAGPLYKLSKKIADPLVKKIGQGDMMALHFVRL